MCGRYALTVTAEQIAETFALLTVPAFRPSWNIAPSALVPVVRTAADGGRECVLLRWGFIPAWAKSPTAVPMLNNARAESLAAKPAFRAAWKQRRCVVPADGWYEWDEKVAPRQPYYFARADGRLAALAGLWETWRSPDGELIDSFAIVTRDANEQTRVVHDRMPKLLAPDEIAPWLAADAPLDLLGAPVATPLAIRRVSRAVNNVRNDSAKNIEASTEDVQDAPVPQQSSLF